MGTDETTQKLFPPPEGGHDRAHAPAELPPIPLAPSIRVEFAAHHSAILGYFATFEEMLDKRLPKPPESGEDLREDPDLPSPRSVRQKVTGGALVALRYGGVAVAGGELAAAIARALGRPEIAGPIEVITQLFRGG
jgi:hypothetical protein